jgi:hypothetical protein
MCKKVDCVVCGKPAFYAIIVSGFINRIHLGVCKAKFMRDNPDRREGLTEVQLNAYLNNQLN